jgi:hypothetical protein
VETLQEVIGKENPTTLSTMANLALIYKSQGQWKEAEALYLHVMEVQARVLGEDDRNVLGTKGNLALLYSMQGR